MKILKILIGWIKPENKFEIVARILGVGFICEAVLLIFTNYELNKISQICAVLVMILIALFGEWGLKENKENK